MLPNTLSLKGSLKIRYFHFPARSGLKRNVTCSNWNSWCSGYKSKLSKQFCLVCRQFSPCFRALILISFMLTFALVHWLFCHYLPVFHSHSCYIYCPFCYISLLFYAFFPFSTLLLWKPWGNIWIKLQGKNKLTAWGFLTPEKTENVYNVFT